MARPAVAIGARPTWHHVEVSVTELVAVVLFLVTTLWVSVLIALSVTGNAPSASLLSLINQAKPS